MIEQHPGERFEGGEVRRVTDLLYEQIGSILNVKDLSCRTKGNPPVGNIGFVISELKLPTANWQESKNAIIQICADCTTESLSVKPTFDNDSHTINIEVKSVTNK